MSCPRALSKTANWQWTGCIFWAWDCRILLLGLSCHMITIYLVRSTGVRNGYCLNRST